jgi:hypothetical protein
MKTTLSVYDFRDAFTRAGRKDQFSYDALGLIFDYLEDQERDLGEEYDLDVIGLCCELSEDYCEDIAANYSIDISECIDEQTTIETVLDYLQDETTVIGTTPAGTIVYVQF